MSRETVEMVRGGIRPPVEKAPEELVDLRAKVIELRGELQAAQAQRDGTQRALDKANRDNDVLRAEIRALKAALVAPAAEALAVDPKRLVDGGEVLYRFG